MSEKKNQSIVEDYTDLLNVLQEIEMAREISKVDQDLIPVFDGDKITLKSYINACEFVIEEYLPIAPQSPNDLRMAKRLLLVFMGKLRAKAREAVDANKTPTTWPELKTILIHSFGDKRSEDVLVYDLNSLTPKREDTTTSYANKIKATLYTLLSKINLEEGNAPLRQIKQNQYNQIALRTYLFGLDLISPQIGMEVKLRRPNDIETAEAYALEVVNYNTQKQRFLSNFRHPVMQQQRPMLPPAQQQQQQQQRQSTQQVNKYIPPAQLRPQPQIRPIQYPGQQQQRPYQPNQFARSPLQLQQRPYRPTPMDVDTSAQKRPASSLIKPPPKRQWISNNIETPEEIVEPEEDDAYECAGSSQEITYYEQEIFPEEQEDEQQDFRQTRLMEHPT